MTRFDLLIMFFATGTLVGIAVAFICIVAPIRCDERWGEHQHRWVGLVGGCQVQTARGEWIPEDRYQMIEVR